MSQGVEVAAITAVVGIVTAGLAYLGIRYQARTARSGSDVAASTQEREHLLEGWRALYDAHTDELNRLREQQEADRRQQKADRDQQDLDRKKLEALTRELNRWRQVAKTLARWGVAMRDQLRALGHEVPAEPDELVALRILSDAQGDDLTGRDLP